MLIPILLLPALESESQSPWEAPAPGLGDDGKLQVQYGKRNDGSALLGDIPRANTAIRETLRRLQGPDEPILLRQ